MKSYVLISAAVNQEVEDIIRQVDAASVINIGKRKVVSGQINKMPVKIVVTGPCIVNAVQAITSVIENSRPIMIIQTGCGGVFKEKGLRIGDICIAIKEIDVQLGIESDDPGDFIKELPFSLHTKNKNRITNIYPVDLKLADFAFKILHKRFSHNTKIKKGTFITVSTITATNKRADLLFKFFGQSIEYMEGAGVAHLSMFYSIPFLEIRCGSYIVGKRNLSNWNLSAAFKKGNIAVYELLKRLASDKV